MTTGETKQGSPDEAGPEFRDNRAERRFEAVTDRGTATLDYTRQSDVIIFVHTEVPEALRGRGIAGALAAFGIDAARQEGLRIIAECPVVKKYLQTHPAPAGG